MSQTNAMGQLGAGTVFGHYQIVRHIGSGGMGSVYEALHTKLGKRVAIKTLLPHYAANPEAQTRFLREGTLAAKLRHPHVVDVTDFGIEEGVPYLVMEFLEGYDLAALLSRQTRLFPQQIADLMVPVTAALASAHDQQIVHRDLKPQNIFLITSKSGELVPKVLDFGISKLLGDGDASQLTGTQSLLGTPSFMSPEQAKSSKRVDPRSDQYTLAVILYVCVTGTLPFSGDGIYDLISKVVAGNFEPPGALIPGLPPEFENLILRGMSSSPDERFSTTWEFGAALLPFASARTQAVWQGEFGGSSATAFSGTNSNPFAPTPIPLANTPGLAGVSPRAGTPHPSHAPVSPAALAARPSLGPKPSGAPGEAAATPTAYEARQDPLSSQPTRLGTSAGPGTAARPANVRGPSRTNQRALPPKADEDEAESPSSESNDPSGDASDADLGDAAQAGLPTRSKGTTIAIGLALVAALGGGAWYALGTSATPSPGAASPLREREPAPAAPAPSPSIPVAPTPAPVVPVAAPAAVAAPTAPPPTPTPAPAPAAAPTPAAVDAKVEKTAATPPKHGHGAKAASHAPAAAAKDCTVPFTIDAQGHKVPKPECEE